MSNQAIVHLRASGNAPELRVYTEDDSPQATQLLCQELVKLLQRLLPT
ncbi:MAG: hypothetical protein KC467_04985 [Marinomonas atlantica]|nr:hypothetical protein [Marinomonas atlantica]